MIPDPAQQNRPLVIFGAWFYSRVVAESAVMAGWSLKGFVDPTPPESAATLDHMPDDASVIIAIGDNNLRSKVYARLVEHGRNLVSICHPSACVSPSAVIGPGCYLAENAVVRTNARVGAGTLLNSGAVVSHDCTVGDFVTFGPNAATGGHVSVGSRTLVGVGASIRPETHIGEDCTLGAGAAVVADLPNGSTAVGNPARTIETRKRPVQQSDWENNRIW
jgi:sugar O-acyltransferase (sialic acid O-acetyltransferase NeuD family)